VRLSSTEIIGLLGGALINCGFVPQVIRIFRLKSAREISFLFIIFLLGGLACWLIYGLRQHLAAVIFWNSVLLVLGAALLYAKLRYGKEK
jgi:MtN3 and saliva related transmembrane protein